MNSFYKKINLAFLTFLLVLNFSLSQNLYAQFSIKKKIIIPKQTPMFSSKKKKKKPVTQKEIASGFKEALSIGTENVVMKLGSTDGFNKDPKFHIPLPPKLKKMKRNFAKLGKGQIFNELELKLNRAAEKASPIAKKVFWEAIKQMTFQDIMNIYNGPKDSATKYFENKMTPMLIEEMRPIIENSLSEVGAIQTYERVMASYIKFGIVPDIKKDLTEYVLEKSLEAMFYYIAQEEIAIRTNPVRRITDLLKRVFS